MSGKSLAIDLLIGQTNLQLSTQSKLDVDSIESFEHIPPIPKSTISAVDFNLIASGVVSQLIPRTLLLPNESVGIIPLVYRYKGMNVIPVGIEGEAICCNAIVPESMYSNNYDHCGQGYTHAPKVGQYRGEVYCLTDELLLLCTQ